MGAKGRQGAVLIDISRRFQLHLSRLRGRDERSSLLGRRARQRNCAPERGGWGKSVSTRPARLAEAPPPQPSPASGRGSALPPLRYHPSSTIVPRDLPDS